VKRRPLKLRVSPRKGATCPEDLAQALTDYLTGRTKAAPTIRIANVRNP
jgi:hypothetical protein